MGAITDVVIPQPDNTVEACDNPVSEKCVFIEKSYPLIKNSKGITLENLLTLMASRMSLMNREIYNLRRELNELKIR